MERVVLFYPHIPKDVPLKVAETLRTRWVGQGPKVDQFERYFSKSFANNSPCISRYGIPIIQDSAYAIGAKYKGQNLTDLTDLSCYSFQEIKSITTGDGGMLVVKGKELSKKAKRMRWFGIDRKKVKGELGQY